MTALENKARNQVEHLTEADVEAIGSELDAIRQSVLDTRGERDAAYIRRVIDTQRKLEMAGRVLLLASIAQKWKFAIVPETRVELLPLITLRPKFGMKLRIQSN